jgi:hypothetical protein
MVVNFENPVFCDTAVSNIKAYRKHVEVKISYIAEYQNDMHLLCPTSHIP